MSTTSDLGEPKPADRPDHDPGLCLFRLSPDRPGPGMEVKTVPVDRADLAKTVLADACWHACADEAGLPLPPTSGSAQVGRCLGGMSFPTRIDAFDHALWGVTGEDVVPQIARTPRGPAIQAAREGDLSVVDSVSLRSPDGRLHSKTSVVWTLSVRPYPRVRDFRMGEEWLLVDAPGDHRSWHAWIVSTPTIAYEQYGDVATVLKGRLRCIWRLAMVAQMATNP